MTLRCIWSICLASISRKTCNSSIVDLALTSIRVVILAHGLLLFFIHSWSPSGRRHPNMNELLICLSTQMFSNHNSRVSPDERAGRENSLKYHHLRNKKHEQFNESKSEWKTFVLLQYFHCAWPESSKRVETLSYWRESLCNWIMKIS